MKSIIIFGVRKNEKKASQIYIILFVINLLTWQGKAHFYEMQNGYFHSYYGKLDCFAIYSSSFFQKTNRHRIYMLNLNINQSIARSFNLFFFHSNTFSVDWKHHFGKKATNIDRFWFFSLSFVLHQSESVRSSLNWKICISIAKYNTIRNTTNKNRSK